MLWSYSRIKLCLHVTGILNKVVAGWGGLIKGTRGPVLEIYKKPAPPLLALPSVFLSWLRPVDATHLRCRFSILPWSCGHYDVVSRHCSQCPGRAAVTVPSPSTALSALVERPLQCCLPVLPALPWWSGRYGVVSRHYRHCPSRAAVTVSFPGI